MIAILQRVKRARVSVDGTDVGACGKGFLILLGVAEGDDLRDCELLAAKISKLRVFTDENDKMNLSVKDIGGSVLAVPNFTLLASYKKGNRPDFMSSAHPTVAKPLFEAFCELLAGEGIPVERGVFGADMAVELVNDGPVTIPMDSKVLRGGAK